MLAACLAGLLAGAVLIGAGLVLGSRAGLPARDPRYIAVFVVGLLATIATDVTDKAFIGERRSGRVLVRNLAFSAGKVALLAVPIFTSAHALGLAWTWVLASLASALVLLSALGLLAFAVVELAVPAVAWSQRLPEAVQRRRLPAQVSIRVANVPRMVGRPFDGHALLQIRAAVFVVVEHQG